MAITDGASGWSAMGTRPETATPGPSIPGERGRGTKSTTEEQPVTQASVQVRVILA